MSLCIKTNGMGGQVHLYVFIYTRAHKANPHSLLRLQRIYQVEMEVNEFKAKNFPTIIQMEGWTQAAIPLIIGY